MAAYGNKLYYRAGDITTGPITKLWGEPLKSFKDGHKMVCKQMDLYSANRAGDGQKAVAQGPGQIDLLDSKNPGKPSWPTHVLWNDILTVVREKEGTEVFDIMTVTGDASFIDDEQKQELHAEKIMVWIQQLQEGAKKLDAAGGPRQELRRVEAERRVRAKSPQFVIRQADEFTISFLPKAPPGIRLPSSGFTAARPDNPPAPLDNNGGPPVIGKQAPIEEKKKPEPPIELTANKITTEVFTLGPKKELQELVAKGTSMSSRPATSPARSASISPASC